MTERIEFEYGDYYVTIDHTELGSTRVNYLRFREQHPEAAATSCEDATPNRETEQSAD